eukprot:3938685-Amphidinium_carterae.1
MARERRSILALIVLSKFVRVGLSATSQFSKGRLDFYAQCCVALKSTLAERFSAMLPLHHKTNTAIEYEAPNESARTEACL